MTTNNFPIPPLIKLYRRERVQFTTLAETWLALGAEQVALYTPDDHFIVKWPSTAEASTEVDDSVICGDIRISGEMVGRVCVSIADKARWQSRLKADTDLLSRAFRLEHEMEIMIADLVDTQDQLLALYRLTQSLRSELDIDNMLDVLVKVALELVKVPRGFLILQDKDKPRVVQHPAGEMVAESLNDLYENLRVNGREHLYNHQDMPAPLAQEVDALLLPIRIQERIIAALGLFDKPGGFGSPDIKLARAIAEEAGAQIEKVLLYQKTLQQARLKAELDTAAQIQNRLLPQHIPEVTGVESYGETLQARQVGGDYYDVQKRADGSLLFVVGDISGKGASSALMMAMTRSVIRSRANVFPLPRPGEILTAANNDLYEDYTGVSMFATLFIGSYDPETSRLTYANAGHSPVLLRRADGETEILQAEDMPLGILPDTEFTNGITRFLPDDLLIVATDGFSESVNVGGEMFGYDRLLELADQHAHENPDRIAGIFFDAVATFSDGQAQSDDQTLLVIKGTAI